MTFIEPLLEAGAELASDLIGLGEEIASQLRGRGEAYIPVSSTAIASLSYRRDRTLTVVFTDGTRVALDDFPALELDRWLKSGSIGVYWNANVRGRY